jgi:heme exporter protein D
MFGAHTPFILGAYGVGLAIYAALAVWVLLDYRAQRRALRDLEAQGVKRRSDS